jgi:exonuclease SbcC
MRILAIRGCNLASLAGEFEIDLAHGALASAGVFAIVGPTGAGKSTLLDAMCVALFDRTPRLANRSTVVVGREDDPTALGAQDVRSLLRRGASSGWAEVDFESGDGRRYRARWSVRRARGATDGRFQSQQVTLVELDRGGAPGGLSIDTPGAALGGTKTETLEAIHQRLGLSFDQFRRSALLAQGEFAAFLRADGKDRSELLERMTGTEIYSQLSVRAHVKAALAEQRLRERQATALAIGVLADDARAQAERDLVLAQQAQEASRTRLAAAEAAARWLAEAGRRQRAVADAEVARHSAEQAVDAAAGQRAELVLRRRAEALRPAWDDRVRVERQLAIATGEASNATEAASRAEAQQRELADLRARLAELHAPIREARIAARIVESKRGVRKVQDLEARALAAAADAAWLSAQHELAPAIAKWRDLDGKLGQQAALASEIGSIDRALAEQAQRERTLGGQRKHAASEHTAASTRLLEAQREASAFSQRRGLTLDAARRAEDEARQRCVELDRLVALTGEARGAATALAELDLQLGELETATRADADARKIAEAERDAATLLRDERARVLDELRKAAGYSHARAELVDGDPCPLCGATEHPWHDRGSFDVVIGDAQARLAESAARCEAALAVLATLAARDTHRGKERARLVSCRATAQTSAAATQRKWREQLAALGELLLVDDPATAEATRLAEERADAARGKLDAARAARHQVEAVAKAGAEAQARVQARQTDVEHHAQKLRDIDAAVATLAATVERLRGERAGKLERQAELLATIADALALWLDVPSSGETAAIESARRVLTDLDSGAIAAGTPHRLTALGADALAILDRCRRTLAELATAWHAHASVVADVDAALVDALAASDSIAREAERAVAEQHARRDAAEARCTALRGELADASAHLDAARTEAGFGIDELRRLLAAEPGRVDAIAEQLDTLDRAVDRARTLLAERRRLVEDHAASRPLGGTDPDVFVDANHLDQLAAAVAAADGQAAALAATLAADADARARRAAALAQLADAEHDAEIDRILGEVIGSHDGKLFRSFAQSLTLDGLLAVANSHLEELAPRYQLERVPKHDLELQVIDRDLGNEIRSVQSLSGGESFLVSLALALGLSSMSAHDVRVRTLLIDEGFGTLDPATLDSALAVLDALQATGRQVGVISHVPALVERVGAHVRVSPRGGGRSEVVVADA